MPLACTILVEQIANDAANVILKNEVLLVDPLEQLMTQAVHRLALLIHNIVIFKQMFSRLEVLRFDSFLRCLDTSRDQLRLDRDSLFHS